MEVNLQVPTAATEVRMLVHNIKKDYPSYKFYAVGGWAMRNPEFNDYDIAIYPPSHNYHKEWSKILKRFDNKEFEGKKVDAQIMPSLRKLMKLDAKGMNKVKNNIHFKFFYCEDNIVKDSDAIRVIRLKDNMWLSLKKVVANKHRQKNLHNSPYIFEEL